MNFFERLKAHKPAEPMTLEKMRRLVGAAAPMEIPQVKPAIVKKEVIVMEDEPEIVVKQEKKQQEEQEANTGKKCRPGPETKYDEHLKDGSVLDQLFQTCQLIAGDETWKGDMSTLWNYDALKQDPTLKQTIQANNLFDKFPLVLKPLGCTAIAQTLQLVNGEDYAPNLSLADIIGNVKYRIAFASIASNVIRRNHMMIKGAEPLGFQQRRSVHAEHLYWNIVNAAINSWLETFSIPRSARRSSLRSA